MGCSLQEALKCFLATEGASDLQGVQDPSTRIMCCQCQTKLGVTKLKEARAARIWILPGKCKVSLGKGVEGRAGA
eukprot:1161490-Pelagomonas_calceolata.AAC.6